jgi:hypothetical protein
MSLTLPKLKQFTSTIYIKRRPIAVTGAFCSLYIATCYKALSWENESLRMGIAGSLASILCDTSFHFVDTLNIRAKACTS